MELNYRLLDEHSHMTLWSHLRGGNRWFVQSLAIVLSLFFVSVAAAQTYTASLTGVVTDPTAAVIPDAKVTLKDNERGYAFITITDNVGRYILRNLTPGTYTLTIVSKGFKTYLHGGVVLAVSQNASIDAQLVVGATADSVNVKGEAPLLSAEDATTGQVVSGAFINSLPLLGRDVYDLAFLAPGVTQSAGSGYANGFGINFISDGNRNSTADVMIDGASTTTPDADTGIMDAVITPSVDAVQEFKIEQNNYGADKGLAGGTVINVVTRSGTNTLHGTLFEFAQNTVLNANNWFNDLNGVPKSPSGTNDFGGTVGGPIRKDRTFFFFSYEGHRSNSQSSNTWGVPSAAMREGNFSEICTAGFSASGMCNDPNGQLWDPYSSTYDANIGAAVRSIFIPFNNIATYTSPGNPNLDGTGYQLPAKPGNLIDPVAYKMMQYYPLPNVNVGTSSYNRFANYYSSGDTNSSTNQLSLKIDHRFGGNDTLSGNVSYMAYSSFGPMCWNNVMDPCDPGSDSLHRYQLSLNYAHTFNPTTVLNLTVGYTRAGSYTPGNIAEYPNFNPVTDLGLPSYMMRAGVRAAPAVEVDGYYWSGSNSFGTQTWSISNQNFDNRSLQASLTKVVGKHEFKFGGETRIYHVNYLQYGAPMGMFDFDFSGSSQYGGSGGGDAMASFLMSTTGLNNWGYYETTTHIEPSSQSVAGFALDNFHVNRKLTVNLGLRYEVVLPATEKHNDLGWLDPNVTSALQVPGLPELKGGFEFANSKERSAYNLDPHNFGPRFGFAYRVRPNMVLRGGYGIYYSINHDKASGITGGGYTGYDEITNWYTTYQNDGATPWARLSDPWPNTGPSLPPGNSQGLWTGIGNVANDPIRSWGISPLIQTWSFGIQYQLPGGILVDTTYLGTRGEHLYFGGAENLNHLGSGVESLSSSQIAALLTYVPNPFYGHITDPTAPLSSPTVQQYQLDLPYTQFTEFSGAYSGRPIATSNYNAFQVRLEKRMNKGLQFLVTYTNSKSIDNSSVVSNNTAWLGGFVSLQDPNKPNAERSLSQFNIPQVLQFTYVYQLPWGRGKTWGNGWNHLENGLLGGWQTNGIWRFDNGMPIALTLTGGQSLPTYGGQRPDLLAPLTRNHGSDWLMQYFANPQDAVVPAPFTLGNAPRTLSNIRAPGTNTASLSLFKEFQLDEIRGSHLEFRIEAFNAFNHPQFAAPDGSVNDGTFGLVTGQANSPRQVQVAVKFYW